jgi:hypothetical protein
VHWPGPCRRGPPLLPSLPFPSFQALNVITNVIKQHKHTVNPALVATLIHMKISAVDVSRQTTGPSPGIA